MVFKGKVFEGRESIFTQLYEESRHFRSLVSFLSCAIIISVLSGFLHILLQDDLLRHELSFLKWAFWDTLPEFILVMSVMALLTMPLYFLSHRLKTVRGKVSVISFFILVPILHFMIILDGWVIPLALGISPPLRVIILTCKVPLLMKLCSHYFVSFIHWKKTTRLPKPSDDNGNVENGLSLNGATNGPTRRLYQSHDPVTCRHCSNDTFRHFYYFLVTPTLIFRLSYPMNRKRDWTKIINLFIGLVGLSFAGTFAVRLLLLPILKDTGLKPYNLRYLPRDFFISIFCTLVFLYVFIGIGALHICNNILAELTMFSDRLFYKDWWTSTNLFVWFVKWNSFIQDWIYEYIYQSARKVASAYILPQSRTSTGAISRFLSRMTVFLGSAFVHDYFLGTVFGFYIPVYFFQYFIGGTSLFLVHKLASRNNIKIKGFYLSSTVFLLTFSIFTTIPILVYTLEFYSRINCPKVTHNYQSSDFYVDLVTPRFLSCVNFTFE